LKFRYQLFILFLYENLDRVNFLFSKLVLFFLLLNQRGVFLFNSLLFELKCGDLVNLVLLSISDILLQNNISFVHCLPFSSFLISLLLKGLEFFAEKFLFGFNPVFKHIIAAFQKVVNLMETVN